jgi:hypothetical protein
MAVHDTAPMNTNNPLANSMIVGEVSGGNSFLINPDGISDNEFKEALGKSLQARSLLTANGGNVRYRVDAVMDLTYHTAWNSTPVDGTITYTIYRLTDNQKVFEQKIQSGFAGEHQNIALGVVLFGGSAVNNGHRYAYEKVATDNLASFIGTLNSWAPSR